MQREQQNNLELDLKKRARRRLVGAIALILLLLIALPMLLKQPEDKQAVNEDVKITFSDEPAQFAEMPAPAKGSIESELPAEVVAQTTDTEITDEQKSAAKTVEIAIEPTPTPAKETESNEAESSQASTEAAVTAAASVVAKTEEKPKAQTSEKPVEIASKSAIEKPAIEKPAQPKAENKPKSNARFFVQVGVFSELENVKRLQAKLKEIGFSSAHENVKTDKGNKIRLKTSLFESRDKAASALEKIKAAGLTGMVVSQP